MALREELEQTGNWLFRWRSYVPFLILPLLLLALKDSEFLEKQFGSGVQSIWETICILTSVSGLLIRILTVAWVAEGTSGRNTQAQRAESVNTTGIYSVVRHPLYVGNFFIVLGMMMYVQVWWLILAYALLFWMFYERVIFAEEEFLRRKFGDEYLQWAAKTPIFLPNFKLWLLPKKPFSWKMVLKREYSTLFGIISAFVLLKFFMNLISEGEFKIRLSWIVLMAVGFAIYTTLHIIRKRTRWFHIDIPEKK